MPSMNVSDDAWSQKGPEKHCWEKKQRKEVGNVPVSTKTSQRRRRLFQQAADLQADQLR